MATSDDLIAARTAYVDNADYREDGSLVKAKAFATACRQLLVTPQQSSQGRHGQTFNLALIERQLDEATRFIARKTGGGVRTKRGTFTNFRG